jgi:molybdenum cofactor cytidylyltransferase
VAGIVLAGGSSRRMGRNKLLLRIDGESLARRAARRALAAGLEPVVVVLGHEAELVLRELAGLPVQIVMNAEHAGGIHTSRRAGLTALPADSAAAVVLLADMPFVTDEMLATLVRRYRESSALLVVSEYAGQPAPPILYARALFPEIIQGGGEGRVGQLRREHAAQAVTVAWPAAALLDIDLPEDVERLHAAARVDGSK